MAESHYHGKNKQFNVWLPDEDFEKVLQFLDKFSAGESFSDQARSFLHWLAEQTEGIDQRMLDLKLLQIEEERKKKEWHCLRGVMQDWQTQNPEQRQLFCSGCRQHHPSECAR